MKTNNQALTKMYDAHAHFNDGLYQEKMFPIEAIIEEAEKVGVGYFNNVGFSLKSSIKAIEQVKKFPNAFAVIGIHPNEVGSHKAEDLQTLDRLATDENVVGIGEVGLDYYYSKDEVALQKEWLVKQIELAIKHDLPLMLHIRDAVNTFDAYDDVLTILEPYKDQLKHIVVHCFSANQVYAEKFLAIGAYLEIGGAVTFKNATILQEVTKQIPLEKLLIETDAPYLTPMPHRGEVNFSKFLPLTVAKIAELKNIDVSEVISKTTQNSFNIFTSKIQ